MRWLIPLSSYHQVSHCIVQHVGAISLILTDFGFQKSNHSETDSRQLNALAANQTGHMWVSAGLSAKLWVFTAPTGLCEISRTHFFSFHMGKCDRKQHIIHLKRQEWLEYKYEWNIQTLNQPQGENWCIELWDRIEERPLRIGNLLLVWFIGYWTPLFLLLTLFPTIQVTFNWGLRGFCLLYAKFFLTTTTLCLLAQGM